MVKYWMKTYYDRKTTFLKIPCLKTSWIILFKACAALIISLMSFIVKKIPHISLSRNSSSPIPRKPNWIWSWLFWMVYTSACKRVDMLQNVLLVMWNQQNSACVRSSNRPVDLPQILSSKIGWLGLKAAMEVTAIAWIPWKSLKQPVKLTATSEVVWQIILWDPYLEIYFQLRQSTH